MAPQQRVTGRQGMNGFERRSRRQRGPEGENVVQGVRIDLARDCRIDEQRLDLGSKQQSAASNGVEQRAYSDSIPGQEERLRSTVPDAKRPLTVQFLDRRGPVLFKEVKDDLGIGLGAEAMAFRYEFFTNFDVVEDLTVERDPQRAVVIGHRLTATCDIDDAQSRVSKRCTRLDVNAAIIWPAMIEHRRHRHHAFGVNGLRIRCHHASNAAHSPMCSLSKAVAMVLFPVDALNQPDSFWFLYVCGPFAAYSRNSATYWTAVCSTYAVMTSATDAVDLEFRIGGDLRVRRIGFGAMRILGRGVWGPPRDRNECLATLRRLVDLDLNLID